ncbi:hypothetical protein BC01_199 [Bacillus phage BC01]|nr:hypothetical protein BC01_199 [Bacillus phage BC01]
MFSTSFFYAYFSLACFNTASSCFFISSTSCNFFSNSFDCSFICRAVEIVERSKEEGTNSNAPEFGQRCSIGIVLSLLRLLQ